MDTDKAKDNANDVVFAFDDVDLCLAMKASRKALQNIAAGKPFHVRFHWLCLVIA